MMLDGYSTLLREIAVPGATARRLISPDGLRNDDLGHHLSDLREKIATEAATAPALPAVLDHLRHVHWHYAIETDGTDLAGRTAWARGAQTLLILHGKVLSPTGRVLIGEGAEPGSVPVHPEAVARAERVRRDLAAHGVSVPSGAIPVRSTEETVLRRPDQIAKRAVALVVTADFALSVLDGAPLDWEYMTRIYPRALAERSPLEVALFRDQDAALAARLKWGYEAAGQLLAMCGRVDATFPRDFADQGQVWNASVGVEEPELLRSLRPLPVAQVCEAWEGSRALHHTVTMARAEGLPPPADLDPEIVRQRYRAMEWLTGDQPWDDVQVDVPCWA